MKRIPLTLLTAFAVIPVLAYAHTHLKSSTPADGSIVAAAPSSIMLMFSEATRLTALTLQKAGDKSEQKLAPLPDKASAHVEIPAPKLAPGAYTIRWRALGKDNHVMTGAIKFTLSADGTSAPGKSTAGRHAPPAARPATPAQSAEHQPRSP